MTKRDVGRSYWRWTVTVVESILGVCLWSTGLYWRAMLPTITMIHYRNRKKHECGIKVGNNWHFSVSSSQTAAQTVLVLDSQKDYSKGYCNLNLKEPYQAFHKALACKVPDAHAIWTGLKQRTLVSADQKNLHNVAGGKIIGKHCWKGK